MANDYGVKKTDTNEWVETSTPLILTTEDKATLYTEADAITVAQYLSNSGEGSFAPGRPIRRPH